MTTTIRARYRLQSQQADLHSLPAKDLPVESLWRRQDILAGLNRCSCWGRGGRGGSHCEAAGSATSARGGRLPTDQVYRTCRSGVGAEAAGQAQVCVEGRRAVHPLTKGPLCWSFFFLKGSQG